MNSTQHLEIAYEAAHLELNKLYQNFHDIPGYIRVKTGEELALQEAKKVFGRFNPNDHDLMEANTNNGQGFTVQLEDGQTLHLNNQLELFQKVVAFNKINGGFCDETFIEHTNEQDFITLKSLQFNVEAAKDMLVNAYPDKKSGYAKAREIEKRAQQDFKQSKQRDLPTNDGSKQAQSANLPPQPMAKQASSFNRMRTPLLSSIPNTFRQAKALFDRSDARQKKASQNASSYVSNSSKEQNISLDTTFDSNIATAKNLNKILAEPVSETTPTDIKKLCDELTENTQKIDDLVGDGSKVNKDSLDDYSKKLKKETDEMKARALNHPSAGVSEAISSAISKLMDSLKKIFTKVAAFISKPKETSTSSPE